MKIVRRFANAGAGDYADGDRHRRSMMRLLSAFAALTFALAVSQSAVSADQAWKAGTAKVIITPDEPLWMAGYGGRDHPVEGQLHDLWVKVLVLEAADGHRVVVLTSDLLGIPQSIYRRTLEALQGNSVSDRPTSCSPARTRTAGRCSAGRSSISTRSTLSNCG
jgi:hypothetical protein